MVDHRNGLLVNSYKSYSGDSLNDWNEGTKTRALAMWTINDQMKLLSLNSLYERVMEFHRNVHTKESPLMLVPTSSRFVGGTIRHFDATTHLANVITLSADKSQRIMLPMNYAQLLANCQRIVTTNHQNAARFTDSTLWQGRTPADGTFSANSSTILGDIKHPLPNPTITENRDYYWIHLKDLNSLEIFHSLFKMHDLIYAGFYDLRAHSTMIPTDSELLMSNVICALEDSSFRMYKIYIYIRENVLITYEVELFPNLEECDDPNVFRQSPLRTKDKSTLTPVNTVTSPLVAVDIEPTFTSAAESDTTYRAISSNGQFVSTITDRIMTLLLKHSTKLKEKVLELGVTYLVYEISEQLLAFYDGTIEFMASSLSYFNRIVHLNLLHRERIAMTVKIHLLFAGISFIRRAVEGCVENYAKLTQIESAVIEDHSRFNIRTADLNHASQIARGTPKISFLREEHALYLADLHDSCIFKRSCLQRQAEEIRRIESELDATIQLRTTNTNTLLSLIATTFLPLTFFAGVFGMNFTEDGGYTLSLLNRSYGPNVFVALCLGSFLLSIGFFSYQGWLEFGIFARFYRILNDGYSKIDDTKNVSNRKEGAIHRAEQEEFRRKEESKNMRTSYNQFSNRRRSSSVPGNQNVYSNQDTTAKETIQQKSNIQSSSITNNPESDSTTLNLTLNTADNNFHK